MPLILFIHTLGLSLQIQTQSLEYAMKQAHKKLLGEGSIWCPRLLTLKMENLFSNSRISEHLTEKYALATLLVAFFKSKIENIGSQGSDGYYWKLALIKHNTYHFPHLNCIALSKSPNGAQDKVFFWCR